MVRRKVTNSKFGDALNTLRLHLTKCTRCKLVVRSIIFTGMCDEGVYLAHKVALDSMRLVSLHRKAFSDPSGFIYACPDRMRHGIDYASTAEPHPNVAIQEGLF